MATRRVYLLMVLTAIFWSGAFITGKIATGQFPAFALTFFRFAFALPLIFVILYKKQPDNWFPTSEQWRPILILGIVGTFLYHALFFSALKYTTAINSSLIGATNPMVTALLATIFFSEKMTGSKISGFGMSFLGVFLIVTNGRWEVISQMEFNLGDLLMFTAVWSWAGYSVLSRSFMQKYKLTPLMLTAYTFLTCTIVALPFFLWERPWEYMPNTSWSGWLSIGYMAVFASVLGYLFQLIAIQNIGAAKSSIFVNLVPVFTIIQSVLILGESFSWFKLLCTLCIIAGVYLASRPEVAPQTPLKTDPQISRA